MTRVEEIFNKALELTTSERQELIERLEHHMDDDESEIDQAIMNELNRRLEEYQSGAVKGVDAEDVFRRLQAGLDERRRPA